MGVKSAKHPPKKVEEEQVAPLKNPPPEFEAHLKQTGFQGQLVISQEQLFLPVPPPNLIAEYQAHYPDAAETFFRLALEEAAHRHKMDDLRLESEIQDSKLGMKLGFAISLCGLGVTALALSLEQPWVASVLGGGTLVSLAFAFIRGRKVEKVVRQKNIS